MTEYSSILMSFYLITLLLIRTLQIFRTRSASPHSGRATPTLSVSHRATGTPLSSGSAKRAMRSRRTALGSSLPLGSLSTHAHPRAPLAAPWSAQSSCHGTPSSRRARRTRSRRAYRAAACAREREAAVVLSCVQRPPPLSTFREPGVGERWCSHTFRVLSSVFLFIFIRIRIGIFSLTLTSINFAHLSHFSTVFSLLSFRNNRYQPTYFVASSLSDATTRMRDFCDEHILRPFHVRYSPYSQTIAIDRAVTTHEMDKEGGSAY